MTLNGLIIISYILLPEVEEWVIRVPANQKLRSGGGEKASKMWAPGFYCRARTSDSEVEPKDVFCLVICL